jgi:hypothetical protein
VEPRPLADEEFKTLAVVGPPVPSTIILQESRSGRELASACTIVQPQQPAMPSPTPRRSSLISRRSLFIGSAALIGIGGVSLVLAASHHASDVSLVQGPNPGSAQSTPPIQPTAPSPNGPTPTPGTNPHSWHNAHTSPGTGTTTETYTKPDTSRDTFLCLIGGTQTQYIVLHGLLTARGSLLEGQIELCRSGRQQTVATS